MIALLKYMADLAGSCGGYVRIPTVPLSEAEKAEAREAAKQCGII